MSEHIFHVQFCVFFIYSYSLFFSHVINFPNYQSIKKNDQKHLYYIFLSSNLILFLPYSLIFKEQLYRVGAESRIQGTMQPPAFSVILSDKKNTKTNKTQNNEKELSINTEREIDNKKLFLKKNKNNSSNNLWEDGLIFNPKIFQKNTENFLLKNEVNNDKEKNENETKNDDCVTPNKKKIITTSTTSSSSSSSQLRASSSTSTSIPSSSPSITSSSSSSSFSLLNYDRLIIKDIEGRCLETILRVKSFLKTVYQLSDEKCQSYNPDEKVNSI